MSAQDLMLILNPWGFDVSDLSPDTRASVHLSASQRPRKHVQHVVPSIFGLACDSP